MAEQNPRRAIGIKDSAGAINGSSYSSTVGSFRAAEAVQQRVARPDRIPLSYPQQRLWLIHQLQGSSAEYNIPEVFRLRGELNYEALERTVNAMIERHEILRTSFAEVDGEPVQIVAPRLECRIETIDLSKEPREVQQEQVSAAIWREWEEGFDLGLPPLVRIKLLKISDHEHILLRTFHHIVSDGWSQAIFNREFSHFYQAFCCGEQSGLRPLPLQYADFALWQRTARDASVIEQDLQYWRERLRDIPEVAELAKDRPRPLQPNFAAARCNVIFENLNAVRQIASANHATIYMVLLSALAMLLQRYSGQDDIVIGAPLANRPDPRFEPLIGFFVNPMPLRITLDPNKTFRQLLQEVRRISLDAYRHSNVPFDQIVEELSDHCSLNTTPLFQVVFALQNVPAKVQEMAGLEVEQLRSDRLTARFDLEVHAWERGDRLDFSFVYHRALFDRWRIEQMVRHYITLLNAALSSPDTSVYSINMMTAQERSTLLERFNSSIYPQLPATIAGTFESQVSRQPDAVALLWDNQSLSYADLNHQADHFAQQLKAFGVGQETLVGVSLERSPEMIVALLAILKAGGAYVPIAPDLPTLRRESMIADAKLRYMLTTNRYRPLFEAIAHVILMDVEEVAAQSRQTYNHAQAVDPLNAAYVNFTSGSTGQPKGVLVCQQSVLRLVCEPSYVRLGPESRLLQLAPLSFDAATFEIWGALLNGGSLVIAPSGPVSADEIAEVITRYQINTIWLTVGLLNAVCNEALEGLASVRELLAGGDVLSPGTVKRVMEAHPDCQVINGYGPTECTTFTCCYRVSAEEVLENGVPLGLPINHTRVYVLDDAMQVCPLGVSGELYVGGVGLARGYMNRPDLTAERFVPDPFSAEGERLYRTGDHVRWRRDGVLEFLGRVDHQVKIRGFRIEPGEIEATLKSQPHVGEALVIVRADGPGGKQLVGYVVAEQGAALDGAALRQALRELLPEYMIPAFVMALPELPLTQNGKLDRRALPSPTQHSSSYRAPRTPQEEILCGIFSEVLSAERVGIDDNFFNLGGHSLLATRLASRVRALLGVELPLRKLFELPTVAGVAAQLRQAEKARAPLVRQQRPERLPLSYAQQRLWFIDQLQGGSTEYNMVEGLRLRGELDRNALERALAAIVERHEVLRTRFVEMEGRAVQVITPELRLRVPLEDLSGMSRASKEQRVEAALWREREQPFDLGRGPMLRLRLLKLGDREHVLLRSFHHIVSDGWSQGIFNRELAELYGAYRGGEERELEPLGVQYADFALWQRQRLDEEAMGRELGYWKEQLAGIPGQLELPRDRPRQARQTFAAQLYREVLGKEELAGVKEVGQKGQATLYMVLLACFAVLLERYSGQEDIVVGTLIANRQEEQLEQLMGFFVNSLVMRVRVREKERFRELLEQVRETALAAYGHQELPFERLVEELSPERSLNTTPLYQVMFALQNAPAEEQELAGLEVERIRSGRMTVRFDLELHAWERQEEMELNWVYNPDLFDAWRIEQMAHHYMRLLVATAECPDVEIAALAELSPKEKQEVLASKKQMEEEAQKELSRAGATGARHRGSEISGNDYVAPQTPLEQSLAQIWAELLKLDRVGVDDNFFDVGGHSLLVMELRSAVKQKLQRHLPIVDFFTYSTIRSFARHLECTNGTSLAGNDSQRRAEGRREYLLARKRATSKRPA